ncbi:MAG TPA: SIS domain-containing protein [Allosphingosinicella sp.]|nr:SIS domain-containing protein [Allosphingosinicella sp.]
MIAAESTNLFAEARQAGAVIRSQLFANDGRVAALARRLRAAPPEAVLTCARGSSDHAATFAKYLIETRLGIVTASQAPSIASLYRVPSRPGHALCIAISQSGRSPDLLATVDAAREAGAFILALVNDEDSPLAKRADALIPLHAGIERSVAATKSYVGALAALVHLVAAWSEDEELASALAAAPALLDRAWRADWSVLAEKLRDVNGLYVIGRGLGLGVAQEAALKFKETCGLHAEAFSAAEIRHGPIALAGPGFPLLVFRQSDETEDSVEKLAADVIARGGEVLMAGPPAPGAIALPSEAAHPAIEPMLQIQSFYRAVNALAVARGLDPDSPPHLAKVTETV